MSLEGIKINVLLFKINDLSNLIRRLRPKDNNTSRFSWVCPAIVMDQLILLFVDVKSWYYRDLLNFKDMSNEILNQ